MPCKCCPCFRSFCLCLLVLFISAFRSVDDGKVTLLLPKLIFAGLNFIGVCVGLWKMAKMGLLPVTAADWTSYLVPKYPVEHSGVPLNI